MPMLAQLQRIPVTTRAVWRRWLQANHARSPGVWVVLFKVATGKRSVTFDDVAEEALCFGWVDSRPARLDAERSMRLVTPRKPKSAWSRINKERVARLIAAKRMAKAGLAAIAAAKGNGTWTALDHVETLAQPDDLVTRFARSPGARENFEAFPRSVKRAILEWISTAKTAETRSKRIEETVTKAARNLRANQWRQVGGGSGRKASR